VLRKILKIEDLLEETGKLYNFFLDTLRNMLRPPYEREELFRQSFYMGIQTLPLIGITGFILGIVLSIQTLPVLADFGAESWLPGIVAISIIKEIGPVITALICAGKIGSGIGAELGSMRVTEQIDAMEVSATNPMKYLVATRVLAVTIILPILVIYSDALSLLGSFLATNLNEEMSFTLFFDTVFSNVRLSDIFFAVSKTVFFGFFIGLVSAYKGYFASSGTEGVGKAANSAVVVSSLFVFLIDVIVVQLENLIVN